MSLEVIEMMIKETMRDGVISESEKNTILSEANSFGLSRELVESIIEEQITLFEKRKKEAEENEIIKKNKEENKKYEIWDEVFSKLVREWIRKSKRRILNKKEYMPQLREQAEKMKLDFKWVDSWVAELEKKEQEIAGIKPNPIDKFFDKLEIFFDNIFGKYSK